MNNRGEENEMSISVQNITKSFKDRRNAKERKLILKDISFDVSEGEFVSLLGPSGCGKTTTLTIIAGFQSPDEGKIVVNGKEVSKPGPDRAFMFQNYALYPHMTVRENIAFPLKLRKMDKAEIDQRVEQAAEITDAYRGGGWGENTEESQQAVLSFARSEGIFIENVYTSKVLVGMMDWIEQEKVSGPVCYLHTGGLGSLFAQY